MGRAHLSALANPYAMRSLTTLSLIALFGCSSSALVEDSTAASSTSTWPLLITEYVEGSSWNKALELKNTGTTPVDLASCKLLRYSNGSTSGTTIALPSISLAPGALFSACHSSISRPELCQFRTSLLDFNGDDAIVLSCNGSVVDSIGRVGEQASWSSDGVSTTDQTLRRKCDVISGDQVTTDPFVPKTQWTSSPRDDLSDLGKDACARSTAPEAPAYKLGDIITFRGRHEQRDLSCIGKYQYGHYGATLTASSQEESSRFITTAEITKITDTQITLRITSVTDASSMWKPAQPMAAYGEMTVGQVITVSKQTRPASADAWTAIARTGPTAAAWDANGISLELHAPWPYAGESCGYLYSYATTWHIQHFYRLIASSAQSARAPSASCTTRPACTQSSFFTPAGDFVCRSKYQPEVTTRKTINPIDPYAPYASSDGTGSWRLGFSSPGLTFYPYDTIVCRGAPSACPTTNRWCPPGLSVLPGATGCYDPRTTTIPQGATPWNEPEIGEDGWRMPSVCPQN